MTLEDYGFCAKGEGGAFAASGALGPGGTLPVNTGGGQLSAYYMWGMTPLSEAVIQARGQGGDRQAPRNDVILVSGNGGILGPPLDADRQPAREGTLMTREPGERSDDRQRSGATAVRTRSSTARPATGWSYAAARRAGCWYAPDATGCADCGSEDLAWAEASGEAVLVSWAVAHSRHAEPAPLALVELAEGPWMYARLDGGGRARRRTAPARQPSSIRTRARAIPVFKECGR